LRHGLPTHLPYDIALLEEISDGRFLMTMGRPFAGRNVTCNVGHTACPGLSSKLKCLTIAASTSVASCKAKVDPMHLRGPTPNGR
jgi:hypothetical protein